MFKFIVTSKGANGKTYIDVIEADSPDHLKSKFTIMYSDRVIVRYKIK